MKKIDLFAIGIGIANFYLFFSFVSIATAIIGMQQYMPQKRPLSLIIGVLLAIAFSQQLMGLSKLLTCIETDDDEKYKRIVLAVGKKTIVLLSLFVVTTLLQNFFMFR